MGSKPHFPCVFSASHGELARSLSGAVRAKGGLHGSGRVKVDSEAEKTQGKYAPEPITRDEHGAVPLLSRRGPPTASQPFPTSPTFASAGPSPQGCTLAWACSPWEGRGHAVELAGASTAPVEHPVAGVTPGESASGLQAHRSVGSVQHARGTSESFWEYEPIFTYGGCRSEGAG